MLRIFLATVSLCLAVSAARADRAEDLDTLYEAIGLDEVIGIMREEGLAYGADMRAQMFPERGGTAWDAIVGQIYDIVTMSETARAGLYAGLEGVDLDPLLEFFTSRRGRQIIGFEISAREAMMDESIEAAAEDSLDKMRAEDDPRLALIDRFVEANDLVASNVMGAMNSNYAFYLGLSEGDSFPMKLTENDILADVWSQEEEIRADTETWVYAYLALAYGPLSDEDLEAYIAISETAEGQALNRALFDGFDGMYVDISRALGAAAARFLTGEDI